MNIEAEKYIFEDSLARIDKMLGVAMSEQMPSMELPFINDIPVDRGLCSYCTVMTVRMEIEKCPTVVRLKEMKVFQSELSAILSSHNQCVDIIALGDYVTAVFSTPLKVNIEGVIDKAAMVNSLAQVVSKKGKDIGGGAISVYIGIHYSVIAMMRQGRMNINETEPKGIVWMGDIIKKTKELADMDAPDYRNLKITEVVYNNLKDTYQKLFHKELLEDYYGGDIINTKMKNWVNTNR